MANCRMDNNNNNSNSVESSVEQQHTIPNPLQQQRQVFNCSANVAENSFELCGTVAAAVAPPLSTPLFCSSSSYLFFSVFCIFSSSVCFSSSFCCCCRCFCLAFVSLRDNYSVLLYQFVNELKTLVFSA